MQGRSIGSKRFNVGDAAPRPTRASTYQKDNTAAQLPVPRRRPERQPRALRHGLIASQLGLPMRARDEKNLADEWQERPAAESGWHSQHYTAEDAYAAYRGDSYQGPEDASYDHPYSEQTTNYDEWELQKELVTYEDTYPGYAPDYEQPPPIDLQLPAVAKAYEDEYEQDYRTPTQHTPSPGSYPFAEIASHRAQPSAARWQAQEPIRHSASTIQAHAHGAARQPQATAQRYHGAASARPQNVQRATPRRSVEDEPVVYPHKSSVLKRTLVVLALAGASYAGHHYYLSRASAPTPALPSAAKTVPTPEPPAVLIEPEEAPSPMPLPQAPQESAKARRSAARAALIAERRERRGARRSRGGSDLPSRDELAAARRDRSFASTQEEGRAYASEQDDFTAAQSGVLRINSVPWSQVHIDGALVGHTPQMNLQLPAGRHRVTLVNHEMQLTKTLTVQIAQGKVSTHTVKLAE